MAARGKIRALEKVEDAPKDRAYYENSVWAAIKEYYFTEYNAETVEEISKLSQNSFVSACEYARRLCVNREDLLTVTPHELNGNGAHGVAYNESYDPEKVDMLCSVYISICFRLDRVPSVFAFSVLSGIDRTTLQAWVQEQGQGVSIASRRNTPKRSVENIRAARAVSLQNVAITGGRGTVGSLACLNNEFWGKQEIEKPQVAALQVWELPTLNATTGSLEDQGNGQALPVLRPSAAVEDAAGLPVLG